MGIAGMLAMAESARALVRHLKRLLSDRTGGVAVLTAVALTGLLGAAGLGTEATMWYVAKRNMQAAADAAAFTAATANAAGNSGGAQSAAKAITARYGYTDGTGSIVVKVNNPPKAGGYTSNGQAYEVVVSETQSMLFSQLFLTSAPSISARAVALPGSSGGPCVMALDKGNVTDISDSGGATLNLNSCGIDINSSSSSALNLSGSASITAYSANIVGHYTNTGTGTFTATKGIVQGGSAVPDPWASQTIPSYSGCNKTNYQVTTTATITPSSPTTPYVFCGTLTVGANATLTLSPGIYVINSGNLSVQSGATLNGTGGVSIILTSSAGSTHVGQVQESGTTAPTMKITAPTTGPTAGLAIYQDRTASTCVQSGVTNCNVIAGSSTQSISGAMYFPAQSVSYSGSASTSSTQCTQLVGYTVNFSGTTNFYANCTGTGVKGMTTGSTKLVE